MDDRLEEDVRRKAARAMTTASNPVARLQLYCQSRGSDGVLQLGKLFRRMDTDKSRKVDKGELHEGLLHYGYEVTEGESAEIFATIDADSDNQIDVDEFLLSIRPSMNASRMELVLKAFDKADSTKDGVITADDIKRTYNTRCQPAVLNGDISEEQALNKFLSIFESSAKAVRDCRVTREEFLDYYAGLSASMDSDAYFSLVIHRAWKL